jgi:hypothetical protein
MNSDTLKQTIRDIVNEAFLLKNKYTTEINAPVNYTCIFAQSESEYKELNEAAQSIGKIIKQTDTGPIYFISDLETIAGMLRILKIRISDSTRPERGDADFTVLDYSSFKNKYLGQPGFKLITRPEMEMIELMQPDYDARVYFSNPPIDQQLQREK